MKWGGKAMLVRAASEQPPLHKVPLEGKEWCYIGLGGTCWIFYICGFGRENKLLFIYLLRVLPSVWYSSTSGCFWMSHRRWAWNFSVLEWYNWTIYLRNDCPLSLRNLNKFDALGYLLFFCQDLKKLGFKGQDSVAKNSVTFSFELN